LIWRLNRLAAGRRWQRWLLRGIVLVGALGVVIVIVLAVVIVRYGMADRAKPADVIVVLGGGEEGTTRRAQHAAALYHQGIAPVVLCVGGTTWTSGLSEAAHCAAVAGQLGVPADAIIIEADSLSTEENAIRSAALMRGRGWSTAVVVSDDYHLLRARWMFARQGVTAWTSPAQITTGSLKLSEKTISVLREIGALVWYALKTLLGLPYTRVDGV
jgi:uncharacterized SAM-binding protein YcdF (DUF218 family)